MFLTSRSAVAAVCWRWPRMPYHQTTTTARSSATRRRNTWWWRNQMTTSLDGWLVVITWNMERVEHANECCNLKHNGGMCGRQTFTIYIHISGRDSFKFGFKFGASDVYVHPNKQNKIRHILRYAPTRAPICYIVLIRPLWTTHHHHQHKFNSASCLSCTI